MSSVRVVWRPDAHLVQGIGKLVVGDKAMKRETHDMRLATHTSLNERPRQST